jgi:hypothetical protein
LPAVQIAFVPQALPQTPQLTSLVATSTHAPAQSTKPAGQTHFPTTQVLPAAQALPQLPQLAGLVDRSTQLVPQAPKGEAQVPTHEPT